MPKIKKLFKIIGRIFIVGVLLIILFMVSLFINHNFIISHCLMNNFKDLIKTEESIEIMQSKTAHGKLCGNGNGINYFGTVLVKADSEEALKEVSNKLDEEFEAVGYVIQSGTQIDNYFIEHLSLEYNEPITEGETYYSIYYFNSSNKYSYTLDIRGH